MVHEACGCEEDARGTEYVKVGGRSRFNPPPLNALSSFKAEREWTCDAGAESPLTCAGPASRLRIGADTGGGASATISTRKTQYPSAAATKENAATIAMTDRRGDVAADPELTVLTTVAALMPAQPARHEVKMVATKPISYGVARGIKFTELEHFWRMRPVANRSSSARHRGHQRFARQACDAIYATLCARPAPGAGMARRQFV